MVEAIRQRITNTPPEETFGKDDLTVLILGCDEDLYYGGTQVLKHQARSDMMLLAKMDFKNKRITGVSIPRDTLVRLPGFRPHKINAYHALGKTPDEGAELAKQAVESIVPVPIDKVITIDYDAFQEVVNMIGGVPLYVDKPMNYDDNAGHLHIHFKPGQQLLDGYNAMCFVRFRHDDGDLARQKRQKEFLLAFKDVIRRHMLEIGSIAEKSKGVLGGALTDPEIISLANFATKVGSENIKLGQIPVLDAGNYNFKVDKRRLRQTLREYGLTEAKDARVSLRS